MGKLYKKPNYVTVDVDWRYSDYKKSNSMYEYNQYNIKTHLSWLKKVLKYTFANGRKQTQSFIPYSPMYLSDKIPTNQIHIKVKNENNGKEEDRVVWEKLSNEDEVKNEKYDIRKEGNSRLLNKIDNYKDKQRIAIDIYISDYLNWEVRNNYKRMNYMDDNKTLGKWYIERVVYRFRRINPLSGSELSQTTQFKEIIDKQSMSYNCLWDLTNHIFSVCFNWSEEMFDDGLEKYYHPIKQKHNLQSGVDNLKNLTIKLGDDYMRYLHRINNEEERKWEWNEDFDKLFKEVMNKQI